MLVAVGECLQSDQFPSVKERATFPQPFPNPN